MSKSVKKILFIDRDGTMIREAPPTYQIDSWDKLEFYPGAIFYLSKIASELDYELVMITNQDGLGTASYAENTFWPIHNHVMKTFENEGVVFKDTFIDRSFAKDRSPNRKPEIGLVKHYLDDITYDVRGSFVIGDRITDVQLAKNLGCSAIWLNNDPALGAGEEKDDMSNLAGCIALETTSWKSIYEFLRKSTRKITHHRNTNETKISIEIDLEGEGKSEISTGLGFFDHMLDQIARHGKMDLIIKCAGDLHVDEHHTIEDTGIALGEAVNSALGNKAGIERYGFALPMDEAEAKVLIDFGGRSWIVWNAKFSREKVGDMPTEMFFHFFKSFSDAAKCNLHIECNGENEHHKIEAIFKAFAKSIRMAVRKDPFSNYLPSTKGVL